MKSRSRYRLCVAALLFSLVMHALAVGGTAVLLQPGMDAGASVLERATYVAGYVWLWRLGWLAWQLTALSDLLLSASLLAYLTATTSQERCGWAVFWAGLSLVATIVAVIPDQWAEASYVSSFVEAAQVVRGGGSQGEYVAVEARYLMMVGTCGNAGYSAMGFCWMLATAFAAGGVRRNWQFVLLGMITWCMFTAAGIANWRAAAGASVSGFPGFDLVVWFNAMAFPLLLIWMVMMAHVLGKGHHARHFRTDDRPSWCLARRRGSEIEARRGFDSDREQKRSSLLLRIAITTSDAPFSRLSLQKLAIAFRPLESRPNSHGASVSHHRSA